MIPCLYPCYQGIWGLSETAPDSLLQRGVRSELGFLGPARATAFAKRYRHAQIRFLTPLTRGRPDSNFLAEYGMFYLPSLGLVSTIPIISIAPSHSAAIIRHVLARVSGDAENVRFAAEAP